MESQTYNIKSKNDLFNVKQLIQIGFLILLTLFMLGLYIHSLIYAEVNPDAGYYLGLAQQIVDGTYLYKDVANAYTPLSMYYFSVFILLFGSNYTIILFSIFIILFTSAIFIFLITKNITRSNKVSSTFAIAYLLACYYYESSYILLEPFVNLFGLISIFFLLKNDEKERNYYYLFAGLFASLAFFSKQYGAVYILFCPLYILLQPKNIILKIKSILLTGLGCLIPLIILLVWYALVEISPLEFISSLIHTTYAEKSFAVYSHALIDFIYVNGLVFVFIPILLLTNSFDSKTKLNVILFTFLLAVFTLVYMVKNYPHYSMLLLPACFLIISLIYATIIQRRSRLALLIFIFLFGLTLTQHVKRTFKRSLFNDSNWNRKEQLITAKEINKIIPPKSPTFILIDYEYFFLCHLYPNSPKKYGYTFYNALGDNDYINSVSKSNIFILNKNTGKNKKVIDSGIIGNRYFLKNKEIEIIIRK
jgi:4-amino-4-deoxy-L-arabinose transferase-like glycosyltransferase